MQNPVDARIAEEVRINRVFDQRAQSVAPPPLPDRALIGERLADHGEDSGRQARTKLAEALADLCKQVGKMRQNPTLNDAQKLLGVDDMVQSHINQMLAQCDEQAAITDTMLRTVEAGIESAVTPPPGLAPLLPEFRAALLDMNNDQREAFIERLQGTRHESALRYAIASVPPELSGVSFGIHRDMEGTLLALKDPSLLSRPGDLKKRRAALAVARDGITRAGAELVDGEAASILRAFVPGSDAP